MKKIIAAILSICMMTAGISAFALPEAQTYGNNISVTGKLLEEREGDSVSILMYDKDSTLEKEERILHIGMTEVQYGGDYKYKFKYTMPSGKTLDDYTIKAKIGADDVTDSIISIENDSMNAFDVSVRMDAYFTPEVTIINKLERAMGAKIIISAYTDAGELTGIKIVDTDVPYDQMGEGFKVNIAELGGDYIKAFMWDEELTAIPLAEAGRGNTASDTKFKDGDVISITGSSSVHISTAPAFIDHFYQTRYPDIDVTVYNTGVGGDRVYMVLDRLEWDVYYGNPDKIYLLCGGNDLGYWNYGVGKEEITESKLQSIYNSLSNYQKFIDTMNADGKDFVFLGTALMDEGDYTGAVTDETFYKGANKAVGILNAKVSELAEEKGIKNIDFFNYTTQITNKLRENDPTAPALARSDRIHLTDGGYFVEGALILLAQGNDEVVSTVEIDVNDTDNMTVKNAGVTVTEAAADKLVYEYNPSSIPLANGSWYKDAEKLYPITEKLNQEIIKVTGLEAGDYTIRFTDKDMNEYNLGTFTSDELANGVNIAINANNPGQIQSMTAMAKQVTRRTKEQNVRSRVADMVEKETYKDEAVIADFNAAKDAAQAYAAQAKALSIPKDYTVTIEKN